MDHSFWILTLFVALIGATVGQDMDSILQDAKHKIEMDQLKNRKPGEGPTFPACNNQTTGKLMYEFTAKFPAYVQITRPFMDFRTIIFGHALDCNKKTQLYEQATIAVAEERGLQDFLSGDGDIFKNLGKAKKNLTPKGLCEEEYLICKNLIQDICVFTKKTTIYDKKDLHKMVNKIRYLPAVQGVCAQREQKRRAELAEKKKKGLLSNLTGNDKKSGGLFGLGGGSGGLFGGNSGGLFGGLGRRK